MNNLLRLQFDNIDMFMEDIQAWDIDFKIIQPGGFHAHLVQLLSEDVLVTYAKLGSGIHQEGIAPAGYRTFVVIGTQCQGFWWLGKNITSDDILVFPESNELHCVSKNDFEVYTVSIQKTLYEQMRYDLGYMSNSNCYRVVRKDKKDINGLRLMLNKILKNNSTVNIENLKHNLARKIIACTSRESKYSTSMRKRDKAVIKILEHIKTIPYGHTPDMTELCRITKMSERSLQYAFNERYQVSPAFFVRAWKLNQARRALQASDSRNTSVSRVAKYYGFNHPGQFSAYYKEMFAEQPLITLKRQF